MKSSSGRTLKVEVPYGYKIRIDGTPIHVVPALRKLRNIIDQTVVYRKYSNALMIDQEVMTAISTFEHNGGYAGLTLHEFLKKTFGGNK